MGPDDEIENEDETLDDQESEQSNVDESETDKDPKAAKGESARESIRRAFKQTQEKEENESEENVKESKSNRKDGVRSKSKQGEDETTDSGDETEEVLEDNETKQPKVQKQVVKTTNSPPPGWTKEAKAHWNNLPQEIKDSVAKREQEVSDGFKEYGEKVRNFEAREKELNDISSSFAGREPELQRLGVTKAQVVKQMFQWIDALGHQDKNYARSQLIQLGKNYGIDLTAAQAPNKEESKEDVNLPPELKTLADSINSRFETIDNKFNQDLQQRQQLQLQQQRQSAEEFVNNWAKDKPHFQTVRQAMFGLLQSGSIPLKDNKLDLDEAYNQAVYANPVTRLAIQQEAEEKAEQEAEKQRKDKELKNLRKVNKAKSASSSISSRSPTGTVMKPGERKDGKPPSVRDSIKASLSELRDQQ